MCFCGMDLNFIMTLHSRLGRFEKTNEMLINFNALSASRFPIMSERFQQHTHTLTELKRDLDTIFRRIRNLQRKLERQHPQAFQGVFDLLSGLKRKVVRGHLYITYTNDKMST
uniref:KxDL motif-containing protein 1 n=1 Tax=Eptatretus burgeri TaxID=7764 RepID=A0A8C4WUA8_EPTBU